MFCCYFCCFDSASVPRAKDWLNEEFEGVTRATTDVNLARNWLLQMGQGAADNGITIQYD